MPEKLVKIHMGEQRASALLDPVRLDLIRLESRLARFIAVTRISESDEATLSSALDAIAAVRAQVAKLQLDAK